MIFKNDDDNSSNNDYSSLLSSNNENNLITQQQQQQLFNSTNYLPLTSISQNQPEKREVGIIEKILVNS